MRKITLLLFTVLASYGLNAQDTCATAVPVTAGITTVGTINGTEVPQPVCALNGDVTTNPAGEWYSYTPSQLEVVTINTDLPQNDGVVNSDDTRVHIYEGSCGALVCVAGNDDIDGQSNFLSNVLFRADPGVTYYIAWDNRWNGAGFDFELTVDIPNCSVNFPFVEDFDNAVDFAGCYTVIDQDGNGTAWIQQELELQPLTPSFFSTNGTNDATKEDYLFSPAISMTAGNTYDISATYNGADAANGAANEDLEVLVASGPTVADANSGTSVFTDTGIVQTGDFADVEIQATTTSGQFVPTTSGDYHIVFKSTGTPTAIGGTTGFLLLFEYSVDETLSVDQFESLDFNYFVNEQSILNLSANQPLTGVKVFNLLGQEVMNEELSANNEAIDINTLSRGTYIAQVQINNSVKTFKFMKI